MGLGGGGGGKEEGGGGGGRGTNTLLGGKEIRGTGKEKSSKEVLSNNYLFSL